MPEESSVAGRLNKIFFICCLLVYSFLLFSFLFWLTLFLAPFFSFLGTSFYFTLTLHYAMNQSFWPFQFVFACLFLLCWESNGNGVVSWLGEGLEQRARVMKTIGPWSQQINIWMTLLFMRWYNAANIALSKLDYVILLFVHSILR
jgi:hypothetical protein